MQRARAPKIIGKLQHKSSRVHNRALSRVHREYRRANARVKRRNRSRVDHSHMRGERSYRHAASAHLHIRVEQRRHDRHRA